MGVEVISLFAMIVILVLLAWLTINRVVKVLTEPLFPCPVAAGAFVEVMNRR